ncbi:MAG: hypothetical protein K2I93_08215, partial [Oscillospiraceae bacterium]|nr:hypothetical protein [Oscillospiraceae bacterium]
MAEKTSFIIRHENEKQFNKLSDERLGKLFRAIYRFSAHQEKPSFDDDEVLEMLFSVIEGQLERDAKKYKETCKKRADNGKKGGRPSEAKKANGFSESQEKQVKAKKADTDSECVCECVTV